MEVPVQARIVTAERLTNSIVIKFSDGRIALYSTSLLYATLPQAEELDESETLW